MRTENLDYPIDPMKAQRPIKGEKAKKKNSEETRRCGIVDSEDEVRVFESRKAGVLWKLKRTMH